MVLELYYDLLSQPCRAVYLFLKVNDVDFVPVEMELYKGDHFKPEHVKKNPFRKLPIIDDDGFVLSESVTIMHYIAKKYKLANHWFPNANLQQETRVDEFMNWQHLSIRRPCLDVFYNTIRGRMSIGPFPKQPIDQALVDKDKEEIRKAVKHLDEYFLKDKPFIAGDEISAADIIGMVELYHLRAVEEDGLYKSNTKVAAWMQRVIDRLEPHCSVVNKSLEPMRAKYIEAKL